MGQLAKLTPRSDKVRVTFTGRFFPSFSPRSEGVWTYFFLLERYVFLVSSKKIWWSDTTDEILNTIECYRKTQKKTIFCDDFTDCFASDKSPQKRYKSSLKRVFAIT